MTFLFHDLTERVLPTSLCYNILLQRAINSIYFIYIEYNFHALIILLIIYIYIYICTGVPVPEETDEVTTIKSTTITAISIDPEIKGHSMDDILPGTKTPPSPVIFVDVPEHIETELGSSVLLACRTANPVAECQWSWQPLPPVHLPLPDISETPATS